MKVPATWVSDRWMTLSDSEGNTTPILRCRMACLHTLPSRTSVAAMHTRAIHASSSRKR